MDIQKFYEAIGVDYNIIIKRLRKDYLIEKYLRLIVTDDNFAHLEKAVDHGNYEEAFKAAHTIKGMALNLELTPLAEASADLSGYLRDHCFAPDDAAVVTEKSQKIIGIYENIQNLIN